MIELFRRGLSPPRGVAMAAIVAIGALISTQAPAKHDAMKDDPEEETQERAAAQDQSSGGHSTVIRGEILESHDRLSPEVKDIERLHAFRITLSGKNHVSETWTDRREDLDPRSMQAGNHRNKSDFRIARDESTATIGDSRSNVVWRVLGPKKLQRIFAGRHFLLIVNIELDANNACAIDARYLKQTGFESISMRSLPMRGDANGEMAEFSLPRVERASCSIQ